MAEEQTQTKAHHGKRFFSWTFPEFEVHTRGVWWYIIASFVVAGFMIYAILSQTYLFAVIIAISAFVFLVRMQRKPQLVTFTITEDGLEVHETFYPYKDLKSFWIIYEPPEVKKVYFEFKSGIRPMLAIPLESQNPVAIRETLLSYIEEDTKREEELFSDVLQRKLKM